MAAKRERWIKVSAAAEQIGTSVWTVYALIRARKLAAYQDEDTGRWRVEAGSVEAYLRARTTTAQIPAAVLAQAERLPMADEPWRGSIFGRERAQKRSRPPRLKVVG